MFCSVLLKHRPMDLFVSSCRTYPVFGIGLSGNTRPGDTSQKPNKVKGLALKRPWIYKSNIELSLTYGNLV